MTKRFGAVLAASDLTESSDAVVRAAGEIAAATGADLRVLHAFDVPSRSGGIAGASATGRLPDRLKEAERALDGQIRRVVSRDVRLADRKIEISVAHRAIAEYAESSRVDLIVVGAHSHQRIGDELLGSTADRVVRSAAVPCLVLRAPLSLPLRQVVAPVDRSDAAQGALKAAMEWGLMLGSPAASGRTAELTVLHVLPKALQMPDFPIDTEEIANDLRGDVQSAQDAVHGAASLRVGEVVRWGEGTVEEIVRYSRERSADLLVIGTHGHGAMTRFLIGSVASGVARRADCAVLLVPPGA